MTALSIQVVSLIGTWDLVSCHSWNPDFLIDSAFNPLDKKQPAARDFLMSRSVVICCINVQPWHHCCAWSCLNYIKEVKQMAEEHEARQPYKCAVCGAKFDFRISCKTT
jgi:hypothetical protein